MPRLDASLVALVALAAAATLAGCPGGSDPLLGTLDDHARGHDGSPADGAGGGAADADAAAASPPPLEALFNPRIFEAYVALIGAAERRVRVAHLEFVWTSPDGPVGRVADALIAAAERGVDVRVLIEHDLEGNPDAAERLRASGVEARTDGASPITVHNKLLVADDAAIVGSANLSAGGLIDNHETALLVRDAGAADWLARYLDGLWEDPDRYLDPPHDGRGAVRPLGDRAFADAVVPLIAAAREAVRVVTYGMSWDPAFSDGPVPRLATELVRAAGRGVDVRVVLERSSFDQGLNELNRRSRDALIERGVAARMDTEARVTHAKLVVADGTAVTGSSNWSFSALEQYHASDAIARDPEAAAAFADWFDRLWQASE